MANSLFLITGILVGIAVFFTFIRLLLGPSLVDRAVALDAMTIMSLSAIVLIAMFLGRVIYLDAALVYGILSFLGIIALARYLEKEL